MDKGRFVPQYVTKSLDRCLLQKIPHRLTDCDNTFMHLSHLNIIIKILFISEEIVRFGPIEKLYTQRVFIYSFAILNVFFKEMQNTR